MEIGLLFGHYSFSNLIFTESLEDVKLKLTRRNPLTRMTRHMTADNFRFRSAGTIFCFESTKSAHISNGWENKNHLLQKCFKLICSYCVVTILPISQSSVKLIKIKLVE